MIKPYTTFLKEEFMMFLVFSQVAQTFWCFHSKPAGLAGLGKTE